MRRGIKYLYLAFIWSFQTYKRIPNNYNNYYY